jgi:hypothetical protein
VLAVAEARFAAVGVADEAERGVDVVADLLAERRPAFALSRETKNFEATPRASKTGPASFAS